MNRILLALVINFWKLLLLFPRHMHKGLAYILGNLIYLMPIKRNKIKRRLRNIVDESVKKVLIKLSACLSIWLRPISLNSKNNQCC